MYSKHVLCVALASGSRRVGCPALRFKDACKQGIKSAQIGMEFLEYAAVGRNKYRHAVWSGIGKAEESRNELWTEKSERRRERHPTKSNPLHQTVYTCSISNRDCY